MGQGGTGEAILKCTPGKQVIYKKHIFKKETSEVSAVRSSSIIDHVYRSLL